VQPNPKIRTRKDIATLNAKSPEIIAFKKAVAAMKKLPAKDGRNWMTQAHIHGTVQSFGACQHGNWYFLPWHREYLYYFEEICRELSGDDNFALPYWDWSKNDSLSDLFWGGGNPLDDPPAKMPPPFGRSIKQGEKIDPDDFNEFVAPKVIKGLLDIPDFQTFGGGKVAMPGPPVQAGELEGTPHNFIHNWVGGDMGTGASPTDPIFWLHHCNVDRLWTEWSLRHPDNTPNDAGWLKTTFSDFYDRKGMKIATSVTVKDTLDTAGLSYQYDRRDAPVSAAPVRMFGTLATVGSAKLTLGNETASFSLNPDDALRKFATESAIGGVFRDKRVARLTIEGVKVPANHNVALRVFVNCQKLGKDTPITDPSYVGSYTFFGNHAHDGDQRVSFFLNVTPAFQRLYGDRKFTKDEPLKISVVARPLGVSNAWKGTVQEISPTQVQFAVVGADG
jgi:hypothetical protein